MWSVLGSLAVALLTVIAFRLHLSFISASFCYLLLLVLQSLSGELVSSLIVAVLAVGCLDYFLCRAAFYVPSGEPSSIH